MELWGTHHFNKNDLILVACSGGPDSMCLCHLLLQGSYNFHIAHVNYQLRGFDSDGDAAFVKSWAEEHNIPIHIKAFNTKDEMEQKGLSLQECARVLRYTWFDKLVREFEYKFVLTAHHRDDSIETFFINAFRGSGIKGLKGIPGMRKNIIRPLIKYNKLEIIEYLSKTNVEYRTDSSNTENKYLRNKIRNQLIPLINKIKPGAIDNVAKTISILESQSRYLEMTLNNELEKFLLHQKDEIHYPIQGDGFDEIRLFHWLDNFGFNYEQIKEICRGANQKKSGSYWHSKGNRILLDRGIIILGKKENHSSLFIKINHPGDSEQIINNRIKIKIIDPSKADLNFKKYFYLVADKISWPLIARNWNEGDVIHPFGLKGKSKKLSDLFIDLKIPRNIKSKLIILESGGEIIFVEQVGIDYRLRIDDTTKSALRIEPLTPSP